MGNLEKNIQAPETIKSKLSKGGEKSHGEEVSRLDLSTGNIFLNIFFFQPTVSILTAKNPSQVPEISPSPDGEVPATFYRLDFGFEESPSVGQQMPEALRKRLENRKEQLGFQQKKVLQPDKGEKSQGEKNEKFQSEKAEKSEKQLEKKLEKTVEKFHDEKFLDEKTASPSAKASARASFTRARPGDEIPPLALETTRKRRSNSIGGLGHRRASREEATGLHQGAATSRAPREKHEKPGGPNLGIGSGSVPGPRSGKVPPEKIVEKGEVGTNSGGQGGRQMFDKNTLRMMHREVFKGAIGRYQQRMLECHGSIFMQF